MSDAGTADLERRLRVIQLDVRDLKKQARIFHDSDDDPALRPALEEHIRTIYAQLQELAAEVRLKAPKHL